MRKALLVLVLSGILVLAGCSSNTENVPDIGTPYIGGTQGLAMSFPQGMPPAEIYDDGQGVFSIGIMLENVGESAVGVGTRNTYGHVEIIGINPRNFRTDGSATEFNDLYVSFDEAEVTLEQARRGYDGSIIAGDSTLVNFPSLSYVVDATGNQELTVRANVCYEYRTYAQGEVCIKDNLLENAQDDTICTLSGAKPLATSGAPVQVTQLTQNPAGSNRIQVTFTIENIGTGTVFAPMSTTSNRDQICVANAGANTQRDVVDVEVTLGDEFTTEYIVSCPLMGGIDSGSVRMYGGAPATVSCTIEGLDDIAGRIFTENLNIDLHYTYLEYVETPLIVRDTDGGAVERGREE